MLRILLVLLWILLLWGAGKGVGLETKECGRLAATSNWSYPL